MPQYLSEKCDIALMFAFGIYNLLLNDFLSL